MNRSNSQCSVIPKQSKRIVVDEGGMLHFHSDCVSFPEFPFQTTKTVAVGKRGTFSTGKRGESYTTLRTQFWPYLFLHLVQSSNHVLHRIRPAMQKMKLPYGRCNKWVLMTMRFTLPTWDSARALGRLFGSFTRQQRTKSTKSGDHLPSLASSGDGRVVMSVTTFEGGMLKRGGCPSASSMAVMPNDQMSAWIWDLKNKRNKRVIARFLDHFRCHPVGSTHCRMMSHATIGRVSGNTKVRQFYQTWRGQ